MSKIFNLFQLSDKKNMLNDILTFWMYFDWLLKLTENIVYAKNCMCIDTLIYDISHML